MKTIQSALLIASLSIISFASFAQSISATGSTIDEAESRIAQQAKKEGFNYKITQSYSGNKVHMTAVLIK